LQWFAKVASLGVLVICVWFEIMGIKGGIIGTDAYGFGAS